MHLKHSDDLDVSPHLQQEHVSLEDHLCSSDAAKSQQIDQCTAIALDSAPVVSTDKTNQQNENVLKSHSSDLDHAPTVNQAQETTVHAPKDKEEAVSTNDANDQNLSQASDSFEQEQTALVNKEDKSTAPASTNDSPDKLVAKAADSLLPEQITLLKKKARLSLRARARANTDKGINSSVKVDKHRWWHFRWRKALGVALAFVVAGCGSLYLLMHCCAPDLSKFYERSYTLYDKAGNVIYSSMNQDDYHRILTTPADVDPLYIKMLIAAEDERFYQHGGVDILAIGRAFVSNISSGSVVSGASTLAMQVCRMLEPKERTLWGKIKEALGALYLTHYYGREQLLSMYLTLAPFGGNIEGVTAASYMYFKHSPKNLTPAQAALLVALPRSPEFMRPDRHPNRARYYRNEVLKKAVSDKIIKPDILEYATLEPIPNKRFALPNEGFYLGQSIFNSKLITPEIRGLREHTARIITHSMAPQTTTDKEQDKAIGEVVSAHLSKALEHELEHLGNSELYNTHQQVQINSELGEYSQDKSPNNNAPKHLALGPLPHELFSTIDPKVQQILLSAVSDYKYRYVGTSKQESLAIVVVDNESFELLGYVGALGSEFSYVDAALALRSPGSALKPFAYGLAFEQGLLHPNSILLDSPQIYKSYQPRNYDRKFYGELTASKALQASLNLPAVEIMRAIGPINFINMLNQVSNGWDLYNHALESNSYHHGRLVLPAGAEPSLSLVLGGCGISLFDLTQLYAALAHDGAIEPIRVLSAQRPSSSLVKRHKGFYPNALTSKAHDATKHTHKQRLLSSAAARATYNILEGTPAPLGYGRSSYSSGPKISYKTGTSYKHRDAWALGSSNNITVGVWTGRIDGAPHGSNTGYTLAAPILFKVLSQLTSNDRRKKRIKDDVLLHARPPVALSKVNIAALNLVTKREDNKASLGSELTIAFPAHNSRLSLGISRKVMLKFSGGVAPYYVLINDNLSDHLDYFEPTENGFYNITIIDSLGNSVSSQVLVQGL